MMRFAMLLASAIAAAAWAQSPSVPELGAWSGTLGNKQVFACFETDGGRGSVTGSYFYDAHGKTIALSGDADAHRWREGSADAPSGYWRLDKPGSRRLTGEWTSPDGKAHLPLVLERYETLYGSDCWPLFAAEVAGEARNRSKAQPTKSDPQRAFGHAYRESSLMRGAVNSVELLGADEGLASINRRLARSLRDDALMYLMCAGSTPGGTDFSSAVRIVHWTEGYVSLVQSSGGDCGGAHPSWAEIYTTWETASGRRVDVWSWLRGAQPRYGPPDPDKMTYYNAPPALAKLLGRRAARERAKHMPEDKDCPRILEEATEYQVAVHPKGLLFVQDLPHVVQACEQRVVLSPDELRPFLTREGQAAAERIWR